MIMFYLGEHRFDIGRSSLPIFDALLCIQPVFCCLLVFSQRMVYLNDPVAGILMAYAPHRTIITVLCLVTADELYMS